MRVTLALEAIGDNVRAQGRLYEGIIDDALCIGMGRAITGGPLFQKPWVAEITGFDAKYKYSRKFLSPCVDYSQANANGSRGVIHYYHLEPGRVFDVFAMTSWRGRDRYFAATWGGVLSRISNDELDEWLRRHSE